MCNFSAHFLWQNSKKFKRYLILDMTMMLPTKNTESFYLSFKLGHKAMESLKIFKTSILIITVNAKTYSYEVKWNYCK